MATWPAELPQKLLVDGFQYSQQDGRIRTAMDAGPEFQRQRFTAVPIQFGGRIEVDATDHATFWSFFNSTLNLGTDSFTWVHPIDGTAATVRFVAVPQTSAIDSDWFAIQMQLEIEPS